MPRLKFATGVRNAYDLVWHSQNGNLYVPTNGSAANGNTPDNPRTAVNEGLNKVAAQNDYLFKVVRGGYYGHPNPKRGEYILNGGNPTSAVDPAEVVAKSGYSGYRVAPILTQIIAALLMILVAAAHPTASSNIRVILSVVLSRTSY